MARTPEKARRNPGSNGALTNPKDVAKALEHAKKGGMRIGEALIDLNCAARATSTRPWPRSTTWNTSIWTQAVDPSNLEPDPRRFDAQVPDPPLGMENGRLRVAIHDPLDLEMLDILRFRLNKEIRTVAGPQGPDQADARRDVRDHRRPTPSTRRWTRPSTG